MSMTKLIFDIRCFKFDDKFYSEKSFFKLNAQMEKYL